MLELYTLNKYSCSVRRDQPDYERIANGALPLGLGITSKYSLIIEASVLAVGTACSLCEGSARRNKSILMTPRKIVRHSHMKREEYAP